MLSRRLADATFAVVAVAGLFFYLHIAREQWFNTDEWDFLAHRSLGDPASLMRPHNEHWSTLPILVYRLLFHLVGLRTYTPYLLVVVVTHLVIAALLLVVMRRVGVRPWIATAAASMFVFFGSGYENITWGFQIGFLGALAFGLTQLLLADHDGPIERRDGFALVAGLLALLCSGVAITMVLIVGLAVLVRRGWRAALVQTVPLALIYLGWLLTWGRGGYARRSPVDRIPGFVTDVIGTTFRSLGSSPVVGVVIGLVLVGGLALAWGPLRGEELRRRVAAPGSMLAGALVFVVLTGAGRAGPQNEFLHQPYAASRYLYVVAALVLPGLGVAANGIGDRLGRWWPVVLVVFVVGIPGNVNVANDKLSQINAQSQLYRTLVLNTARAPMGRRVPASLQIDPGLARYLTIGWLHDALRDGRLGPAPLIGPHEQADNAMALLLRPSAPPPADATCHPINTDTTRSVAKGTVLTVAQLGSVEVSYKPAPDVESDALQYGSYFGPVAYRLQAGPVTLHFTPRSGTKPGTIQLCS